MGTLMHSGTTAPLQQWLRANRRAIAWAAVFPALLVVIGFACLIGWRSTTGACVAGVSLALGFLLGQTLLRAYHRPRVAYAAGEVFLFLRGAQAVRVPLDVVECFFLGQGPALIGAGPVRTAETANVVIRLAERATDWHQVTVNPRLAAWCDGYITLHGAWCEPVTPQRLEALNANLVAAKREQRQNEDVTPQS